MFIKFFIFILIFRNLLALSVESQPGKDLQGYECISLLVAKKEVAQSLARTPKEFNAIQGIKTAAHQETLLRYFELLHNSRSKHAEVLYSQGERVGHILSEARIKTREIWAIETVAKQESAATREDDNIFSVKVSKNFEALMISSAAGLAFFTASVGSHFLVQDPLLANCTTSSCVAGAVSTVGYLFWRIFQNEEIARAKLSGAGYTTKANYDKRLQALTERFNLPTVIDQIIQDLTQKKPFEVTLRAENQELLGIGNAVVMITYGRKNDREMNPFLILGMREQ